MKKIIGTLLAGAMITGMAFAAKPDITMNYRARIMALQYTQKKEGDKDPVKNLKFMDLHGYNDKSADSFAFKANGENCGVQIQWNMEDTNRNNATGISALSTYNAWMKFGNLTLRAGTWKDGYADGNYRVKKDIDDASLEWQDGEAVKLGGVFKSVGTTFIDDMAHFNGDGNPDTLAFYADYPIKPTDGLTINILAGFVHNVKVPYGIVNEDDDEVIKTLSSGPVARVQLNVKNVLNTEIIWKNASLKKHAFGIYFMPKMVKDLDLNIGASFSLAPDNQGNTDLAIKDAKVVLETWEADLRLRYAINKKLSIFTFNQIAGYTLNTGAENMRYNAGGSLNRVAYCGGNSMSAKAIMAMWNEIGVRYVVSDLITVGLTGGVQSALKSSEEKDKTETYKTSLMWRATPYIQLFAAKGAFINIGFAFSGSVVELTGKDKTTAFGFEVPVVFRVKM